MKLLLVILEVAFRMLGILYALKIYENMNFELCLSRDESEYM